jgi:hypothetical protein
MKVSAEYPINRSENVEVKIDAVSQRTYFKEIDNLRGKKIKVIDTFPVSAVTIAPSGNALVNATAYKKGYLVLVAKGKESINRIPLAALDPTQNNGRRLLFDDIVIDFPKSYVEFPETTGVVVNESVMFDFYFTEE